ncbi:MAG: (d)CMP kinase [Cyclobacteriaceae bacterium]
MKRIVIAIDGYSGTGKSSTAKEVAAKLGYKYIDSGAMYRAVTYYFLREQISSDETVKIKSKLEEIELDFTLDENGDSVICLGGVKVENEIRKPEISERVSAFAAISAVRRKLVCLQNGFGLRKGIVMDGRDIGTVVFPEAELKVFMTADLKVRAKRRLIELENKGLKTELSGVEINLKERDKEDTTRVDSPLTKAEDAVEIDTTDLTFQEQVDKIVTIAKELIRE